MTSNVLVVCPFLKKEEKGLSTEASLEEAVSLAEAINLTVPQRKIFFINSINPGTFLGKGQVEECRKTIDDHQINLVFINYPLSPVQQRNLEKAFDCKVIDRTALILEIFGERARTAEGRLQVELAALTYQRSRLVRSWTHLERQRGGLGFMGGPGESQLELDRRMIDDKIIHIKKDLNKVIKTRHLHRKARKKVPYPIIALVGYTNAGKSTLFNQLVHETVYAKDQLFATLDPTLRHLSLPSGREVMISDTVGFIANLPTSLVAAFRATLEEVICADLILHVRDISHPDTDHQKSSVHDVLKELGIDPWGSSSILEVYNKIDRLSSGDQEELIRKTAYLPDKVSISASSSLNLDILLKKIDAFFGQDEQTLSLKISLTDGAFLAAVYRHGVVLEHQADTEFLYVKVRLSPAAQGKLKIYHPLLKLPIQEMTP